MKRLQPVVPPPVAPVTKYFNAIAALIFKAAFWLAVIALIILCIPGIIAIVIIASWTYFYLTRKKMMRPTEVLLYMGGTALTGLILWFALDAPQKFRTAFQNLTQKPGKYLNRKRVPGAHPKLQHPLHHRRDYHRCRYWAHHEHGLLLQLQPLPMKSNTSPTTGNTSALSNTASPHSRGVSETKPSKL